MEERQGRPRAGRHLDGEDAKRKDVGGRLRMAAVGLGRHVEGRAGAVRPAERVFLVLRQPEVGDLDHVVAC